MKILHYKKKTPEASALWEDNFDRSYNQQILLVIPLKYSSKNTQRINV